jgi:hypothetical protein
LQRRGRASNGGHTHPSLVTDAEYSVDDVFIDVCRDKLHLDGSIAPRGLLGPVLHTELRQERRSQKEAKDKRKGLGTSVSFITESFLLLAGNMD